MRFLLLTLIILGGSAALTQVLLRDPGYMLLVYGSWTLETSLAVAGVGLLLAFLALLLLLRLSLRLWQAPRRFHAWERQRARMRARRSWQQGLLDLAEGNWEQAEGRLLRAVEQAEMPLLNYLAAAWAAQRQAADARRDRYLALAQEAMPSAELAVNLTQAELQFAQGQCEQALDTLLHLRRLAPKHARVLQLLRGLYLRLQDWGGLQELLPELRRQRLGSLQELDALEVQAHGGRLRELAAAGDGDGLARYWSALPRALKCHPALVGIYSQSLRRQGDGEAAERLVREALNRSWSSELAAQYGLLAAADVAEQLSRAEAWLASQPRDAALLLSLGRLCLRSQLWGKARSYFEASIGQGGELSPLAHQELGALLEQMGDKDAALACYRKGLLESLATQGHAASGQ
jgi:HemY protein